MRIVSRISEIQPGGRPVAAALGIFDGVHLGHQALLRQTLAQARARSGLAVAVTFDQHPNAVLAPDHAPPLIQSLPHRLETLAAQGVDVTLLLPFTHEFSQVPATDFVEALAREAAPLADILVGEGFTFGCRRAGNTDLLHSLGTRLGFQTHVLPPVSLDSTMVRSTRIREFIQQGDLAGASRLLGRPYSLAATVVSGDQLGRSLGFPTANLNVSGLALPPNGVYAAHATVRGTTRPAVLNLGLRPTLKQPHPTLRCEVHLLDFHGDLYGADVDVRFVAFLRPEQRFASAPDLQRQIQDDIARARTLLAPP